MKPICDINDFRVPAGKRCNLSKWPTAVDPLYPSKKEYRKLLEAQSEEVSELQRVLYAHNRYALLLIFQGMDSAGKDGAIRHVMSGVNPQGCQVFSFKEPSSEELDHDFLWRTNKRLPERGRIGIFNRSYYEEVLIARVLPDVLAQQRIPKEFLNARTIWKDRYQDINHMENYLHRNGTRIVKFFLHLSIEEQRKRFLDRIDEPDKNWKLSKADIKMRDRWDDFQDAYRRCLSATSTTHAPWFVVPADDKKNARLIVSQIVLHTMQSLNLSYPEPSDAHRAELQDVRELLTD